MKSTKGIVNAIEPVGEDKHKIRVGIDTFYLKSIQHPELGMFVEFNWCYNKTGDKKIVSTWGVEIEPKQSKDLDSVMAMAFDKESLLKAIWASPALATQPGNSDEMPKIAIKWAEESIEWLKN